MTSLTRETLYCRVWAEPMKEITRDLGVSVFALKAACDRADVPTPRAGHWQKAEVGRAPQPPGLPCETRSATEKVALAGRPRGRAVPRAATRPIQSGPGNAEAALEPAKPVEPSEHPAVRKLRKVLEKAKPGPTGFITVAAVGVIPANLSRGTMDRTLAWLEAWLRQAETFDMRFEADTSGVRLRVDGEPIPFRLDEKSDKIPHTPTAAELRTKAERERWAFAYRSDPWPKYDHVPSGRLSIQIEANPYSGLRRTYSDGKTRRLEDLVDDIFDAFRNHAAEIQERRRKTEAAARRAEDEKRRRERLKAFETRETRRAAFVSQMVEALERRADFRRALDHVSAWPHEAAGPPGLRAFLERRLAEEDALLSPGFLTYSARAAKIDFDEERARQAPPEPSWAYPSPVSLELWVEETDRAVAAEPVEWAEATGRLPALEPAPTEDPEL